MYHWPCLFNRLFSFHRYQQAGGKPFFYYFQHRSSRNPWPEWMGVMHGYEIEFVFGLPLNPSLGYTQEEVSMSKRFMKYWATFARTGYLKTSHYSAIPAVGNRIKQNFFFFFQFVRNPGIDGQPWPMFTAKNKAYVTMDTHTPEYKSNLQAQVCWFWDLLF